MSEVSAFTVRKEESLPKKSKQFLRGDAKASFHRNRTPSSIFNRVFIFEQSTGFFLSQQPLSNVCLIVMVVGIMRNKIAQRDW